VWLAPYDPATDASDNVHFAPALSLKKRATGGRHMHRRELLSRIPLVILAIPMIRCASDDPYPPMPGGGNGGGGGDGEEDITEFRVENNDASGHTHWFNVTCEQLQNGQTTWTAQGGHTHNIELTADQIADLLDGQRITINTSGGHPHTWILEMPEAMRC
jgi:hypothetical protein